MITLEHIIAGSDLTAELHAARANQAFWGLAGRRAPEVGLAGIDRFPSRKSRGLHFEVGFLVGPACALRIWYP